MPSEKLFERFPTAFLGCWATGTTKCQIVDSVVPSCSCHKGYTGEYCHQCKNPDQQAGLMMNDYPRCSPGNNEVEMKAGRVNLVLVIICLIGLGSGAVVLSKICFCNDQENHGAEVEVADVGTAPTQEDPLNCDVEETPKSTRNPPAYGHQSLAEVPSNFTVGGSTSNSSSCSGSMVFRRDEIVAETVSENADKQIDAKSVNHSVAGI